jgi:hypothetical protein
MEVFGPTLVNQKSAARVSYPDTRSGKRALQALVWSRNLAICRTNIRNWATADIDLPAQAR